MKNKLDKINELVEKIKKYAYEFSNIYKNIEIYLENSYEHGKEIYVSLFINYLPIMFKICENDKFYIEMSEEYFEELNEISFWQTMYFESIRSLNDKRT